MIFLRSLIYAVLIFLAACGQEPEIPNQPEVDSKLVDAVIPKEILINLLSFLDSQVKENINKDFYRAQIKIIKSKILRHDLTIASTTQYLTDLKKHKELLPKVNSLLTMITKKPDRVKLWLDYYGRLFDSMYVNNLVKNPPKEVQVAMTAIADSLGRNLELVFYDPNFSNLRKSLDSGIHKLIIKKDPRFWFPKVPELNAIKNSPLPAGSTAKVINYLKKEKKNGWELISVPYLLQKLGVLLGKHDTYKNFAPKYFIDADKIYPKIFDEMVKTVRGQRSSKAKPMIILSKEGGIPLKGQPQAIVDPLFIASERPTDDRYPKLKALKSMDPLGKIALLNQLDHGVTWCSGFSGSTNIDLHGWYWVQNNTDPRLQKNVDKKAAFLGIILFLVYDGGHSIYEPLWAASVVNNKLGLDFKLTDNSKIEEFIPDFEKYIDIYKNTSLEQRVVDAFDKAFEKIITNFRIYGHTDFPVSMPSFN
jgi:hypothetical protein